MGVGDKLREFRRQRSMTLIDVRDVTGLSVSFLSDLERGRANPSLDSLHKLAICYNVAISDIMEDMEPSNSIQIFPAGFAEFLAEYGEIEDEFKEMLLTVERRSRNRATVKEDWVRLYYTLKQITGR